MRVFDIEGKEIYNETDKNMNAYYKKQINVGDLAKGMYYLKLTTESGIKIQKLIIR